MTGRRILVVAVACVAFGGIAIGVQRLLTRDPGFSDAHAAEMLVEQSRAEAPLATDIDLPTVTHGEELRKPHARVELGKHDLRLFGRVVSPMPAPDATAFPSVELTGVATWGIGVLDDAGIQSRTLELAADRDVRYGLVVEAYTQLSNGGFVADLFLAKAPDGSLRVFHPIAVMSRKRVHVDEKGAWLEPLDAGGIECRWSVGTSADAFAACVSGPPPQSDAGADSGSLALLLALAEIEAPPVMVMPSTRARYGDVIAVLDGLQGANIAFALGRSLLE